MAPKRKKDGTSNSKDPKKTVTKEEMYEALGRRRDKLEGPLLYNMLKAGKTITEEIDAKIKSLLDFSLDDLFDVNESETSECSLLSQETVNELVKKRREVKQNWLRRRKNSSIAADVMEDEEEEDADDDEDDPDFNENDTFINKKNVKTKNISAEEVKKMADSLYSSEPINRRVESDMDITSGMQYESKLSDGTVVVVTTSKDTKREEEKQKELLADKELRDHIVKRLGMQKGREVGRPPRMNGEAGTVTAGDGLAFEIETEMLYKPEKEILDAAKLVKIGLKLEDPPKTAVFGAGPIAKPTKTLLQTSRKRRRQMRGDKNVSWGDPINECKTYKRDKREHETYESNEEEEDDDVDLVKVVEDTTGLNKKVGFFGNIPQNMVKWNMTKTTQVKEGDNTIYLSNLNPQNGSSADASSLVYQSDGRTKIVDQNRLYIPPVQTTTTYGTHELLGSCQKMLGDRYDVLEALLKSKCLQTEEEVQGLGTSLDTEDKLRLNSIVTTYSREYEEKYLLMAPRPGEYHCVNDVRCQGLKINVENPFILKEMLRPEEFITAYNEGANSAKARGSCLLYSRAAASAAVLAGKGSLTTMSRKSNVIIADFGNTPGVYNDYSMHNCLFPEDNRFIGLMRPVVLFTIHDYESYIHKFEDGTEVLALRQLLPTSDMDKRTLFRTGPEE